MKRGSTARPPPAACRSATRGCCENSGSMTWTEKQPGCPRKCRNSRVSPGGENAMNAKPLRLLLLEDGHKDARFLQKTISDGGSFDCELVKMDELEAVLSAVNEEPPIILLRSGDSSTQLSASLKRVREIASNMPVLVLPKSQHGLILPSAAAGDPAKSNGH